MMPWLPDVSAFCVAVGARVLLLITLLALQCCAAPMLRSNSTKRYSASKFLRDGLVQSSTLQGTGRQLRSALATPPTPIFDIRNDDAATRAALWELYDAAGGANWTWTASTSQVKWTNATSYCNWQGVICCSEVAGEYSVPIRHTELLSYTDVRDPLATLRLAYELFDAGLEKGGLANLISYEVACEVPQAAIVLALDSRSLDGFLPESLGSLSLLSLDVSNNQNLRGSLPASLQSSPLAVLGIVNTSLSCAPEGFDDSGGLLAESFLQGELDLLPPACRDVVRAGPDSKESRSYEMSGQVWVTCPTFRLPGARVPLTLEYTHAMGCRCPSSYTMRIIHNEPGSFEVQCIEPGLVWILVTSSVTGLLVTFLAIKLIGFIIANKQRLRTHYMHWVKENWLPGTIKLGWNEPMDDLVDKDERTGQVLYKVCWVLCRADGVEKLYDVLTEDVANEVMHTYHTTCRTNLKRYHGYTAHVEDDAYFLVAFHEVVDALAWALVTQTALLAAKWPAALDTIPETERIVQQQGAGSQVLFAGIRVAMGMTIAVPKSVAQHAGKMYSKGPHLDMLFLLANATNGTQLITDHQVMHGDMEVLCHMMEMASRRRLRALQFSRRRANAMATSACDDSETMQAFLLRLHAPTSHDESGAAADPAASPKPMIIDMGVHVLSQSAEGRVQANLMQVSTEMMMPQAAIATERCLHTIEKLGKGFFDAPMALQAYTRGPQGERPERSHVVLVFCTMQGYNELFSHKEKLAQHTLVLYCASVRQTLDKVGGYECQELEGTFMLAFAEAHEAINFALVLQLMMLQAPWDPEILSLPPTQEVRGPDGLLLFRGARVKLGIYRGRPESVVPHTSTGRADYFGTMVNRAARMMAASQGGQVLVQNDIIELVREAYNAEPRDTEMWKMEGVLNNKELLVSCGARKGIRVKARPQKRARPSIGPSGSSEVNTIQASERGEAGTSAAVFGHREKRPSLRTEFGTSSGAGGAEGETLSVNGSRRLLTTQTMRLKSGQLQRSADRRTTGTDLTDTTMKTAEMALMASSSLAPEQCLSYLHDVEFHDMGKYSFKGIPGQYDVLQVNTSSIAGRSEHFPKELPQGKAKNISHGKGHVETVQALLISPALVVQELVNHRTYRSYDADMSMR